MIKRIDHIAFCVKHLENSRAFYEKLGFKTKQEFAKPEQSVKICFMTLDDTKIELWHFDKKNVPKHIEGEDVGVRHFSLLVEDIENTAIALRKKGIDVPEDIQTGVTGKYVFFQDPNGIWIELYEPFHS